ncbi:MAG: 23S rRNA (uracil(1939)-C(5))-methyltransferase RlmD [Oscillospiraceae bacterium]
MILTKNTDIDLQIDAITSEGSGVGRYEGMAVFVSGAAVGDLCRVHIIKAKKNYAIGKIIKILTASDARQAVDCKYFPACGGCTFRHIKYEEELKYKKERVNDAFLHLAHIDIKADEIIGADNIEHYRNKAQYPVGVDGELKIGFYSAHSHRIVNCADCNLQPTIFSEITKAFRQFITINNISVYNSEKGKGLLRHIYIRQAQKTGEIMVCAVINGDDLPCKDKLIEQLAEIPNIKSIVLNINKENNNVILGDKLKTIYGDDYITDILCGVKIRLSPLSFYQVNREQAERLYTKAAELAQLTGNETLLDLYCGAGTIGLSMAGKAKKIIGCDIVPQAIEDAKVNAEINDIKSTEFYCGDAPKIAEILNEKGINPNVIILDPPRKGCAKELIDTVCKMSAEKVIYVSCDPATLARDCAIFEDEGYKVKRLTAVDLFPRTVHVECVCLLTRE